jgi:NAD(P)-dependent dehydrogenase (short-subunit alcohol dehydrogenase family)
LDTGEGWDINLKLQHELTAFQPPENCSKSQMKTDTSKQTVLITGTSSGLGKTCAEYFAAHGWNVVATMRQPDADNELKHLPQVLVTALDVTEPATISKSVEMGITQFGRVDAVINNAGFGLFGVFEATPIDKIREQFEVNLFGVMNVIREVLPHFRKNKRGLILNVSSGAGVFTLPMISLYCASKFALEGFSESLSYELASQNIGVKIIEPGGVLSTNFGKRSGAEAARNVPIADYDAFVTSTNEAFAGLRANRVATEEDVAKVVFEAATDGTSTRIELTTGKFVSK